jgi:hypothetical protein
VTRSLLAAAGSAFFSLTLLAPAARADESASSRRAIAAREMDRPYTLAEVELGFLALPAAEVCIQSTTDCERGEGSLAVGIHNHYRFGAFTLGAGIDWATTLRSDRARGADGLKREHSRSYFLVEGQFRYYALRTSDWEGWVGATLGGVIVNDSWSVLADRDPYFDTDFVGPRATSLGTEGFSAGVGVGAEWSFASSWALGTTFRYANWFFPQNPKPLPLNDPASLSGRVDMIALSITLAYRIAL